MKTCFLYTALVALLGAALGAGQLQHNGLRGARRGSSRALTSAAWSPALSSKAAGEAVAPNLPGGDRRRNVRRSFADKAEKVSSKSYPSLAPKSRPARQLDMSLGFGDMDYGGDFTGGDGGDLMLGLDPMANLPFPDAGNFGVIDPMDPMDPFSMGGLSPGFDGGDMYSNINQDALPLLPLDPIYTDSSNQLLDPAWNLPELSQTEFPLNTDLPWNTEELPLDIDQSWSAEGSGEDIAGGNDLSWDAGLPFEDNGESALIGVSSFADVPLYTDKTSSTTSSVRKTPTPTAAAPIGNAPVKPTMKSLLGNGMKFQFNDKKCLTAPKPPVISKGDCTTGAEFIFDRNFGVGKSGGEALRLQQDGTDWLCVTSLNRSLKKGAKIGLEKCTDNNKYQQWSMVKSNKALQLAAADLCLDVQKQQGKGPEMITLQPCQSKPGQSQNLNVTYPEKATNDEQAALPYLKGRSVRPVLSLATGPGMLLENAATGLCVTGSIGETITMVDCSSPSAIGLRPIGQSLTTLTATDGQQDFCIGDEEGTGTAERGKPLIGVECELGKAISARRSDMKNIQTSNGLCLSLNVPSDQSEPTIMQASYCSSREKYQWFEFRTVFQEISYRDGSACLVSAANPSSQSVVAWGSCTASSKLIKVKLNKEDDSLITADGACLGTKDNAIGAGAQLQKIDCSETTARGWALAESGTQLRLETEGAKTTAVMCVERNGMFAVLQKCKAGGNLGQQHIGLRDVPA